MANDFLGKLAKQANQQLGDNESPFKQKKKALVQCKSEKPLTSK
ncbi:hypothetical protein UCCLB521_pB0032 (plasmid) [Levilactobacillus brevis]|nr:hypothetical protein [Levilactobacillus brevis]QCZ56760.1 hypothetical protein UCCLB521_pB0032 [Levilactobacillus brevis]